MGYTLNIIDNTTSIIIYINDEEATVKRVEENLKRLEIIITPIPDIRLKITLLHKFFI